ncbi:hypothetical protein [uncultured Roseobacter sp.]|uniref:hypothetical protein n=1 Tax=uncultured Roseobacter sp. TaxID=114847 RepID=UPI00345BFF0B
MRDDREGEIPRPDFCTASATSFVLGSQESRFTKQALEQFKSARFKVTDACDRMGMRLGGSTLLRPARRMRPSDRLDPVVPAIFRTVIYAYRYLLPVSI